MNISILMDSASLAKLEKMAGWHPGTEFHTAMEDSLGLLQNEAVNFMFATFKDPQGDLEGAFIQTITPEAQGIEGKLENPLAYAWRREKGFSGMTDAIGRYYALDEGIAYMLHSLTTQKAAIKQRWYDAVQATLSSL